MVLGMIGAGLILALLERWKLSGWALLFPCGAILATFAGAGLYGFHLQVVADAALTLTEEDRRAAREASRYPYRAQKERSRAEKWLFFAGELRGRARRLGIDLDAERFEDASEAARLGRSSG